jgi:hypothetical protein
MDTNVELQYEAIANRTRLKFMVNIGALKKYLNMFNKSNKHTCVKFILSYVINQQHVSIAFAIIVMLAVQQQ